MSALMPVRRFRRVHWQRGSTSVEFALVAAFGGFMVALFAAIEVARVLFMMNSANEATELGARAAVICLPKSSQITTRMKEVLPSIPDDKILVDYKPAACADGSAADAQKNCKTVTVSIKPGWKVVTVIPFIDFGFDMPAFTTTLPRESLDSTVCR